MKLGEDKKRDRLRDGDGDWRDFVFMEALLVHSVELWELGSIIADLWDIE